LAYVLHLSGLEGFNVVMRQPILGLLSLSVILGGAACSNYSAEERATPAARGENPTSGSGDMVKVEGCLNGSPDGRVVVTAAPDPLGSTVARAGVDRDRDTNSYVLVGGESLQSHIGKRVEVTGTLIGKKQEVEQEAKQETQSAPASAGSDKTPTVKTSETVDIEVRQLQVAGVRDLAPTCQITP
jgi:hypothetical protein